MKTLRRLTRAVIVSALIVPVALEILIRVYLSSLSQSAPVAPGVPLPYRNAPYYNDEFLVELDSMNGIFELTDHGYRVKHDLHGRYYNIIDGFRATTDQPANVKHTLWFVGSSTTFDVQVPDAYTKASYLQRLVGDRYRVQNIGMTSADSAQELYILKQVPVKSGDLVVMLDGSMDMVASRTILKNRQMLEPTPCHWLLDHVSWSMLVQAGCSAAWLNVIPDQALIQKTYNDYVKAVVRAHDWTVGRGAAFVHFLQPTIYSQTPSGYEVGLGSDGDLYKIVYPIFKNTPYTIDLTHGMDSVRDQAIFFDHVHTNEVGNAAVARAIADNLWLTF